MKKVATNQEIARQCGPDFEIDSLASSNKQIVLTHRNYPLIKFVIPRELPLYGTGEFLLPTTFLEADLEGLLEAFDLQAGYAARVRYMIGHAELQHSPTGNSEVYFCPAHYLVDKKPGWDSHNTHVLVILEYDPRISWDSRSPSVSDLDTLEDKFYTQFYGADDVCGIERVSIIFNINGGATVERQTFVATILEKLMAAVNCSDEILEDYDKRKLEWRDKLVKLTSLLQTNQPNAYNGVNFNYHDECLAIVRAGEESEIYRYNPRDFKNFFDKYIFTNAEMLADPDIKSMAPSTFREPCCSWLQTEEEDRKGEDSDKREDTT